MTREAWVGGDVRENRKDEFIWKFENCENETKDINVRPKELTRELALGLV